jgi:capsule polysaccharide export protein KpsE/RkpR
LAPKWYESVLTVVPSRQQKSGLSGLSGIVGADLGGLASGLDLGGSADVQRIAAVLESNGVSDAVIEKFNLRERYKEKTLEGAREALWSHCSVKPMTKPGLVQLMCEDKDPEFVRVMLSFFAEHGNQVFRQVSVSSASEEVQFLEKHVQELRQQSQDVSEKMRAFQEKNHIVDIDSQSKAVVSVLAALNGQRISKQLEIENARTFSSPGALRQLESELGVLDDKLRDLQERPAADGAGAGTRSTRAGVTGVFPPAVTVPAVRAEYESLYRDRKVAEASLVFALERLEGAKASEARAISTFQVLDPPVTPTRKSRPKRLRIVVYAALLGVFTAVIHEWWQSEGGASATLAWFRGKAPAAEGDGAVSGTSPEA